MKPYDLIVIGSGAAGMMAAITAARNNKRVLLLEKLSKVGTKLKATGGGRCNLTNTLSNSEFMSRFGRDGRFMTPALEALDHEGLRNFFHELGVTTHAPDGFRVFPTTHNALSILHALEEELTRLNVTIVCSSRVDSITIKNNTVTGACVNETLYNANHIIVATGGLGYPQLGAEGDGFKLAKSLEHKITDLSPAMMPLHVKEAWVQNCRADTIAKAHIRVNLKKYKHLKTVGDLIFTKNGIRGPVVLDFSREITPILKKHSEIPLLLNLIRGKNEDEVLKYFKSLISKHRDISLIELVQSLLPQALSHEICIMSDADPQSTFTQLEGNVRASVIKNLCATPLTITGHDGFKMAMITRGGVSLKEINPNSLESKRINNLYFCGEVMNLDGPCGGYNLQFSFSSGHLAGKLLK